MKKVKHMLSVALVYAMVCCLSIPTLAAGEMQPVIVEEPIEEEPIVEEPVVEEPIEEEPIVEEPVVEEPIVEEPIVEEPVVEEPIVEEPVVDELVDPDHSNLKAVLVDTPVVELGNTAPAEYPVTVSRVGTQQVFKFTPAKSDTYLFVGKGELRSIADLYDSNMKLLCDHYWTDSDIFQLSYEMTAGTTYYLKVGYDYGDSVGSYTLCVYTAALYGFACEPLTATTARLTNCRVEGNVVIPETIDGYTITSIDRYTFRHGLDIRTITFPKTMKAFDVYDDFFSNCYNLQALYVDQNSPYLCSVDGVLYSKDRSLLYMYPIGRRADTFRTLPETMCLCYGAFDGSDSLAKVYITNPDTTWYANTFLNLSQEQFVYYKTGGESEKKVIQYTNSGSSYRDDPRRPTYVPYEERPVIVSQPKSLSAVIGTKASFTVKATGEGLTYQWKYSMDNGATWKASTAASAKTATFSITAAEKWNGMKLFCQVTNRDGNVVKSSVAKLTVIPQTIITMQPANVTALSGTKISFTVKATGVGLTYQWKYSMDNGATWKVPTAESAKTATFSITAAEKWNGMKLFCRVTDASGTVTKTSVAKLTVIPKPVISIQPANVGVNEGEKASFTVKATGEGLTYQWKYSMDNGATWKMPTAASAKTATFSITAADQWNGMKLFCRVTDKHGQSVTTKVVSLTVLGGPVIVDQPISRTVTRGSLVHLIVYATGEGRLTYQWYKSMDNGKTWTIYTYKPTRTGGISFEAYESAMYKCVVTDGNGRKTTSDVATITIAQKQYDAQN